MGFTVINAVFLSGHLLAVLTTGSRLSRRSQHSFLWWDDLFSVLTAVANAGLFIRLFIFAVEPTLSRDFRIELAVAFIAVSLSRMSLVMSPTRIDMESLDVVSRAFIIASSTLAIGIFFAFLSVSFCSKVINCHDVACACVPPKWLGVSAFLMELYVDVLLVYHNWLVLADKSLRRFKHMPRRQKAAIMGLYSNVILLVYGIVALALYLKRGFDDSRMMINLIHISVMQASFVTNISTWITALSTFFSDNGPVHDHPNIIIVARSAKRGGGFQIETISITEIEFEDFKIRKARMQADLDRLSVQVRGHASSSRLSPQEQGQASSSRRPTRV